MSAAMIKRSRSAMCVRSMSGHTSAPATLCGHDSTDDELDNDSMGELVCHLCQQPGEVVDKPMYGFYFHALCGKAVRNKYLQYKGVPAAREADGTLMRSNPEAWRASTILSIVV